MTRSAAACTIAIIFAGSLTGLARAQMSAAPKPRRDPSIVATHDGPVHGIVSGNHRAFLGIPYAAPPTGDLRWRAPAPHSSWNTPWDATGFRANCAQPNFVPGMGERSAEDCLYLNVYTPNPSRRHLPVMVWIHGGSFLVGSGADTDGSTLAARGKVIVVTINYRLGPFGFLTLKALDESPDHRSGNYGLLDQQAALRWVARNIDAFGGDPKSVTFFGESAGGISVCMQLVSPDARGLFARAIDQSGPCQILTPIAAAQAQGGKLAARLGCDHASDIAACLRSKPAQAVLAALPASPVAGNGVLWFPVIDGVVLPQAAEAAFKSGNFNRVPLINGSNHDEGTLFAAFGPPITAAQYPELVRQRFGKAAPRVLEEYPLRAYPSASEAWAAVFTDGFFSCSIRHSTRMLAPLMPVYAYEFNDQNAPNTMIPHPHLKLRAFHSAEIQYVFQTRFPNRPRSGAAPLSPGQLKLSDRMMKYWTAFARSGNPGGHAPAWSAYRDAQDEVLSFAPGDISYEPDFARQHHCSLWESLRPK